MSDGAELFEVRVETTFEAGHRRDEAGRETSLHHHEWQVAVRARAAKLDHIGIVIDFRILRAAVDDVVAGLDQRVLDEVDGLAGDGSVPAVAVWIYDRLRDRLAELRRRDDGVGTGGEYRLDAVEVEADAGIRFEYCGG